MKIESVKHSRSFPFDECPLASLNWGDMSAAFKEWAVVCEALGSGRQSILLRKGGIAEGRSGFAFEHEEFFLFPTWVHQQIARTVLPEETPLPEELGNEIEIRYAVSLEWTGCLQDAARLAGLREFHVLSDSVVRERFSFDDKPGIQVALVRVFRLDPPRRIPREKKFGGCRSWVELPDLTDCALVSVISDEEHARRKTRLLAALEANA